MLNGKRILALIPARGGSKGLPRKNLRPLLGKPLVAWSIEQAMKSSCVDLVAVSTDDDEIAAVARVCGIEVPFLRPPEFATDKAPTIDAVLHALDWYAARGEEFDCLALLEPTSPLRRPNDIHDSLAYLLDGSSEAEAVVSLGEVHLENPFVMKTVRDGIVVPLIEQEGGKFYQRQQLPKAYFPYGVMYASLVPALRRERGFYHAATIPYFIERWQNYEIDDLDDFLCVETMMKEHLMKESLT